MQVSTAPESASAISANRSICQEAGYLSFIMMGETLHDTALGPNSRERARIFSAVRFQYGTCGSSSRP